MIKSRSFSKNNSEVYERDSAETLREKVRKISDEKQLVESISGKEKLNCRARAFIQQILRSNTLQI